MNSFYVKQKKKLNFVFIRFRGWLKKNENKNLLEGNLKRQKFIKQKVFIPQIFQFFSLITFFDN